MVYLSKQFACQKYVFKIHSERLRKEKWRLDLPIDEARNNDEVIALADSQILRWIAELNHTEDAEDKARAIRAEIRILQRQDNTPQNRRSIRGLYRDLDNVQFQPDYMCLIIDREKDYRRACKGFYINGIKYKRLLGTNGGIKNSTIVFVSERLHDELEKRITNERDMTQEVVTAKLEAYRALTCSASIPVSMPRGIIVVDDAETEFFEDIVYLSDEDGGEPVMREAKHERIVMDASDGFGLMLPSLAERWSEELELDYIMAGCNTRFSFEKGMVFTFDFLDFAEEVAGDYMVKDAWGIMRDVRDAELILTTSMVKLWDSYVSMEHYIQTSVRNKYTFGITKTCPKELENERTTNYQYLNPYSWLTDDDIEELVRPTIDEINDVLNGDWRKTILFLRGSGINEKNAFSGPDDYVKALMVDKRVLDDPYVQSSIYRLIKNRIDEAKVGVLKVHGNYSICSGDPYLLCQSMFGLEKTGLLKAGEIYNKYWSDADAEKVACFRSPMSSANNIRCLTPVRSDEASRWYKYMDTCTIFNAWDTTAAALNGMDFDGDLVFLTDNNVLVGKFRPQPTLMCVQKKSQKTIPTEEDFVSSNIAGFGNDIGQTTNWITSMFDIQSGYDEDSEQYKTLSYRIQAGQQYQQNAIDKIKGIVSNPMPRSWHDKYAVNDIDDENKKELYRDIVADKKPYYMRYIYPAMMKEYRSYVKKSEKNALREFKLSIQEIEELPEHDRTDRQKEFLHSYYYYMPAGIGNCVTNRVCRRIEREFDGYVGRHNASTSFDYTILKSGRSYTQSQFYKIKQLHDEYNRRMQSYAVQSGYKRVDEYELFMKVQEINNEFREECAKVCSNKFELCDIVLDICYKRNSTKKFAWGMCGSEIIDNLLRNNNYTIFYPTLNVDGNITYGGQKYSLEQKEINTDDSSK